MYNPFRVPIMCIFDITVPILGTVISKMHIIGTLILIILDHFLITF